MQNDELNNVDSPNDVGTEYEAPEIEVTVTREEMEREVQYAGNGTPIRA